ncbi:MAG: hypothetical protein MI748_06990 [Opitutales bacterium]|nr:hypothetical protein [Opitutales bacterium]
MKKRLLHQNIPPTLTLIALLLSGVISIFAQDDIDLDEDVYELSPFLIESDEQGWIATETLAGSRMRTNFQDIATQVEVLTMDFMDDFSFNSPDEAAIYSLNVENGSEFTNSQSGSRMGNTGAMRVRGLSAGTRSREFFEIYHRTDNYNLERVTISSGPNAILFGTGSPAGAIDVSLSRAYFNDRGTVAVQFDSWGSERYEFDYNKVLIEDKLAVRVALLNEDKHFDVDYTGEQSRRFYGTLTYRPFEKTRISLHYENINVESRRPARNAPYDRVRAWLYAGSYGSIYGDEYLFPNTQEWVDDGRFLEDDPLFNNAGNNIVIINGYNPAGVENMSWFGSVNAQSLADGAFGILDSVNADTNGMTLWNDDYYPLDINTMYDLEWEEDTADVYNIFFNQEIIDNLHFEAAFQHETYSDFTGNVMYFNDPITLHVDPNQYLPDGSVNPYAGELYFDGSPQYQENDSERTEWRMALSYEVDLTDRDNWWLRQLGRHQFAGLISARDEENISQEYVYYIQPKLDGNGMMYDPYFVGFPYQADEYGRMALSTLGSGFSAIDGSRQPSIRSYVGLDGGPMIPGSDFTPGDPLSITDSNGDIWVVDPGHAGVGTNGETLITGRNTNGRKSSFKTKQFSYQGYLWEDRIVLTYGWREDTLNSVEEEAPEVMWQNPETGEVVAAGSAGFQAHRDYYFFPEFSDEEEVTGETTLKGIVFHPFRNWDNFSLPFGADLSLSYSESNTFQPNVNSLNPDGSLQDGEAGDGEDYGIRLSLFDGQFSVRWNRYETIAGPTSLNLPFRRFRFALRPTMVSILQGLVANKAEFQEKFPVYPFQDVAADYDDIYPFASGGGWDAMNFFNYGDPYGMTADSAAEGDEVTVTWQPNKNLDVRFTWNDQQVVQTNIATQWIQYAEELYDILENTQFVEGYVPGDSETIFHNPNGYDMDGLDLDPNDGLAPGIDYFTWDQIPFGGGNGRTNPTQVGNLNQPWGQNDDMYEGGWTRDTIKEEFIDQVYEGRNGIPVMQAYEGRPNEFVRQNRWNLNAIYRFTEGVFDGLSVGLGYRWRAAPAVGFATQIVNGSEVPDTSKIIYGEEEKKIDLSFGYKGKSKWLGNRNYTARLNIRNLFPQDDYVPKNIDSFTGESLALIRVDGTQVIFSLEVEI